MSVNTSVKRTVFSLALMASFFAGQNAVAGNLDDIDLSGFIGTETRFFTQNPAHSGQKSGALEGSVIFQPEFRYKSESRNHQFSFIPFARVDSRDSERSHIDIREAYWLWLGNDIDVLVGLNKVFWGVAESRHLVNIINQTDAVEDIDGEDYLGQPMINITTQQDWGRLGIYALPYFRERTFSGIDGRFRGALVVDTDKARYESGAKEHHIDFALRYSHYFGNWDVGLSAFHGTDREPVLSVNDTGTGLIPTYNLINQGGLDLQYTQDGWLWKFEGLIREGQGDTFTAAVGGFEYTFYQINDDAWDLGVLAEYQYDGRDHNAPSTIADRDVFVGARLALNDIQDTSILAGMSFDTQTHEQFYNFEAERRIGENYSLEIRARFLSGSDIGDDTYPLSRDDYIQLRFSRFF